MLLSYILFTPRWGKQSKATRRLRAWMFATILSVLGSPAVSETYAEDGHDGSASEVERLKAQVEALKGALARRPYDPNSYPVPERLTFCGQVVKFEGSDLKRRFELELIKILKNRAQVGLYIKRATAVFPVIDDIALELNTCADLKYVAVVESALKPRVMSHAKAVGWWQFMPRTAEGFKLQVNAYLDERSDLVASTRAALRYLTRLKKRFRGSWLMSMAGYNTGPGRLKRLLGEQAQERFWDLDLFTEAERYSPRVLAMYHVLTHLKEYDFTRTLKDGWPQEPLMVYRVFLKTSIYKRRGKPESKSKRRAKRGAKRSSKRGAKRGSKNKLSARVDPRVYMERLALNLKVPVRDLRRYNPHLLKDRLPIGVNFHLYIPPSASRRLQRALGDQAKLKQVYRNHAARARGAETHGADAELEDQAQREAERAQRELAQAKRDAAEAYREEIDRLGGEIKETYTVRPGDQLWQIAARAQVSVSRLRVLNGLNSLSVLRVGQRLRVSP